MSHPGVNPSRMLYYIPIIHTLADMGGLAHGLRRTSLHKLTVKAWRHKLRSIDQFWDRIEQAIEALPSCCTAFRLYQDGLPVCGKEDEIVATLAQQGSRNHKLLANLMEKGAILMGTESSELLLQEYRAVKNALEPGKRSSSANRSGNRSNTPDELLIKRDQFIAERINATLQPGETGLLFLGVLHAPHRFLASDIAIKTLTEEKRWKQ